MSVFPAHTCCFYHTEVAISYMIGGFSPNHWNTKKETIAFSFGPALEHFLTIVAHNMRSPLLVLVAKMNFKISLVGLLHKQGYVTFLMLECVATTDVTEGIRLVSTVMSQ